MRVIDFQCYERARELFARYKNLTQVWEQLKQEGHRKAYGTIAKYYRKNKEEWDNLHDEYDKNSAQSAVKQYRDKAIEELSDIKNQLKTKITQHLSDDEAKKIDSQAIFALKGIVTEIDFLIQKIQPKENPSEKIIKIVMDVLLSHNVLGPQITDHRDEILKSVEKRLQRTK